MSEIQYTKIIKNVIETDVLVIGGGTAGFGAAIAAARNGAKTLLIERLSIIGGMATAGLVGPFMTCYDNDAEEQLVKGIFDELCLRTEARGGAIHPSKVEGMTSFSSYYMASHRHVTPYQSEVLAVVMEEMLLESGAQILFNVQVTDCITKDKKIDYVIVNMKEGIAAIRAKLFIDCTGDADVAYFAGVPTWLGNKETGIMQPTSLFFEVGNIDREKYLGELEANKSNLDNHVANCFAKYVEEAKRNGDWTLDRNELGNYEQNILGRWKINTTRIAHIDATKTSDITKALIEGRRQVQEVIAFMKKYLPGCENVQLIQVATALGVRETRHIVGKYELTAEDILSRKHFDDAICTFGYAIDIHNSTGGGVTFTCVDKYYTIPYRCLIPENCDNMLVAGRSICGSSEAAASFRVMPACVAMGQAAGTAAAIALKSGVCPENVDIVKLRNTLIEQGAVIKD
ncbi:FAD-dependent oxidoreductase [Ruminiclostridium cellulolyticum]|uniref:FAD dependent oxidoreductase n=1 Tax=Ruminiclostridium cellulolyticum (strain ATCC 35319 / DSM 5812 / JCM 6584 / H10) TaxID=394503 RepID=B8I946_RUMCH|nr:FAD-dependent oxidoreductase [Ruminiclostridium cellulolyticum]ACL75306.1 FAD dependent oxidoreductase [Ruminiclostridium cellulolyticum H10]